MIAIPNSLKIKIHKIYRKLVFRLPFNYSPGFLIIGVQKAGTTTLFNHLNKHPKLSGSLIKEVGYFHRDERFSKGKIWYGRHFKSLVWPRPDRVYFEATPEYITDKTYLERIYNFNPDMKLIIVLRDPVARAYSAWNFYKKFKQYESISEFSSCVRKEMDVINGFAEEDSYTALKIVRRGLYVDQIKKCVELFGEQNLYVVTAKKLKSDPVKALNGILSFLGIPDSKWDFLSFKDRNVGHYKAEMDTQTKEYLKEFYNSKNQGLQELIPFSSIDNFEL